MNVTSAVIKSWSYCGELSTHHLRQSLGSSNQRL
jgi:hypothetical protein